MKCEAIIGQSKNEPQFCGQEAMEYEIRAKKLLPDKNIHHPAGRPLGTIVVKASLCDHHKRKAIREGKELIPVGETRPGILTHIDTN